MSLFDPDDQAGDWYGWATNQAGHAAIVGAPAALLLLGLGLGPLAAITAVALVYALGWEVITIWSDPGRYLADSLSDTAHVTAGAALITAALCWGYWPTVAALVIWALMLAAGIWRRL